MAALKSLSLPFVILTISLAFYSFQASAFPSAPAAGPLDDSKVPEPIDPKDPKVVKIGQFAVAEQNRKPKSTKLEFVSVVKADILVVAGLNYRLVIAATEVGVKSPANYLAIVRDGGDRVLKLISFNKTT
ncbi:cysteine proteinase inhibitor 5 [Phtheirospermum japonicum]|uniref:Cysteine proteinase inhibitor 5 n=1 Tax=Phtheirospermum japonicum TaxID=374723 RepID=A0A830D033_9LAMI|nr:cysteine proteinase inhibitor 5 [Phtheirospermum japonicum]